MNVLSAWFDPTADDPTTATKWVRARRQRCRQARLTFDASTPAPQMSGTSMACPAVTGAAAVLLARLPGTKPAAVRRALLAAAVQGRVTDAGEGRRVALRGEPDSSGVAYDIAACVAPGAVLTRC